MLNLIYLYGNKKFSEEMNVFTFRDNYAIGPKISLNIQFKYPYTRVLKTKGLEIFTSIVRVFF